MIFWQKISKTFLSGQNPTSIFKSGGILAKFLKLRSYVVYKKVIHCISAKKTFLSGKSPASTFKKWCILASKYSTNFLKLRSKVVYKKIIHDIWLKKKSKTIL